MNLKDFEQTIRAFTDDPNDLHLAHGELVVQIRDEVIEASLSLSEGDLFVEEHGSKERAFDWLIKRVARVPQLASRIANYVLQEPYFVTPAGTILDRLDDNASDINSVVSDVPKEVVRLLSDKRAGTSTILYLTSDAGEGKTTVIDHIALQQAQYYQHGKTNWLLIPMRLGGRSFLTFEDVVVAELVNRFRFQFFYYDAFIELVRLGVLVPAFDGFEEVFVEGSPIEAVSSLGNLVRTLDSSGSIVVAVRKAHFEYHNFQHQARLLDATSDVDATFARISLERWDREHFLQYADRRKLPVVERKHVYDRVKERLGANHPLLTRAVLAKRLVDVAQEDDIDNLIANLGTDGADYFFHFVNAIVEREVAEKWIDRSGTPHQSLLTVEEHHVLLMMISKEMWITLSDAIDGDYLALIAELFAEEFGKTSSVARQIENRIGQHSLMATNRAQWNAFSFDHDDFKMFYWGEAIAKMLEEEDAKGLRLYLDKRRLPDVSADSAVAAMKRRETAFTALALLVGLARRGPATSYIAENVGSLAIRILDAVDYEGTSLVGMYFVADALKGRKLTNVDFLECTFAGSSLERSELTDVSFRNCNFDELDLAKDTKVFRVRMDNCDISRVVSMVGDYVYGPARMASVLCDIGFEVDAEGADEEVGKTAGFVQRDERAMVAERALRTFLRASAVNQMTLDRRLGLKSRIFFEEVLPLMIEYGVLGEVEYKGRGQPQRRFRLGVPMLRIGECLADPSWSSLEEFLERLLDDG